MNKAFTRQKQMWWRRRLKKYFLVYKKNIRFDFADELKIGVVRYKYLTETTIKVQLFWRLSYEM